MLFLFILGFFWCSVVTSVTLSSEPSNFEKIKLIPPLKKEILKTQKLQKI